MESRHPTGNATDAMDLKGLDGVLHSSDDEWLYEAAAEVSANTTPQRACATPDWGDIDENALIEAAIKIKEQIELERVVAAMVAAPERSELDVFLNQIAGGRAASETVSCPHCDSKFTTVRVLL